MTKRLLILSCAVLFLCAGCNLIYKQNIQQGNALEQDDLDQLELGMTKNQVSFLLGTPAIQDPFHQDRWDYLSSFSRRGGDPVRRLVTLEFDNGSLVSMTGVREGEGTEELTADGARPLPSANEDGIPTDLVETGVPTTRAPEYRDGWSVQAGSFDSRTAADERAAALEAAGYEANVYTQVNGRREHYIVRSGNYSDRAEALAAMAAIEAATGARTYLVSPGT
ncbi:outer membrane protein assembly factor BamE domain-containing protein [Marinihelvus fidelis]|nr:outer membrane protein assembly factor BamE [Marinihelvus fidelis]